MKDLASYLFATPWPGLIVWSLFYISDYYMTLACARLYQGGVREKIAFEGSYEITPYFQRDIDGLRRVSLRFLGALAYTWVVLGLTWWFSLQSTAELYQALLGAMICVQLAVHVRHFRNLFLFRAITQSDAVRGQIRYSRVTVLQMSAVELFAFAGAFLCVFLVTHSWFVFGGAVSCAVTASKHRNLARKALSPAPAAAQTSPVTQS
jgi:hypothetical protein